MGVEGCVEIDSPRCFFVLLFSHIGFFVERWKGSSVGKRENKRKYEQYSLFITIIL